MTEDNRPSSAFARRPDELRRIHDQLDELAADRDQMGLLLQLAIEISSDLELDPTLYRIIRAALTLTGARYGAIGVWGPDDLLTSFVHEGMDPRTVEHIGHLPVGKGILGALRERTDLLNLRDLTEHAASAGFPEGHPPMRSFLGMPIRIRGEPFGSLYVADDRPGHSFTGADELTARALASVAAVAIDNARLFNQMRVAASWTNASREITAAVLSDEQPEMLRPLRLIAERALQLTDAEQAIVLIPDDPDAAEDEVQTLVVSAAVGTYADDVLGQRIPVAGSTTGAVFRSGEPVITETFRRPIESFTDAGERPAIVAPLRAEQHTLGVIAVARNASGPPFDTSYLNLVSDFAGHAAIALTIAKARRDTAELDLLSDRERIAHDLHDQVIQRVFAVGMDLQGVIARMRNPALIQRVSRSVDELQSVITDIRTTIFNLQKSSATHEGFPARIHDVFESLTESIDVAASLNVSGPLSVVTATLADHAEAVFTEALSNAIRHSGAAEIIASITVGDDLSIMVSDNGKGIPPDNQRSSGLRNLARRAESAHGQFTVADRPGGGTDVVWSVPLTVE
ncbi:GAF sensor signal transduction histidine kinase [Mycolicibacterium cosmeticum]|uniref:GAF sensor signal transduction histidine kinase n=2 Tax=Mycolicibacterium cosmeticum TaxID=258533 RepID=W9BM96_MYCCO|nr:GAF domain-containing sensor histidine kinase [Mycolicibacterium cosmeticum]CDO11015.1 GAF sensor signal transduction histidine kinase [Mycolicibacterium cosmeticum]